jgi:beta-glucosidase
LLNPTPATANPPISGTGAWIDFDKDGVRSPFETAGVPIEQRVEDLLGRMTLEEKTCQLATLYGYNRVLKEDLPSSAWDKEVWKDGIANIDEQLNGVPDWRNGTLNPHVWPASSHAEAINTIQRWFIEKTRLGIPVDFTNEGVRGLNHWKATNFPAQIGVGATWDRDLVDAIGTVTGSEAKALGYTNIYSPILDVARDPRWGRMPECYGEDPWLVTELGVRQAAALQKTGVASTAKHFAIYSIPKGGRDGMARTDPHVSPREMEMMHLWPFEQVIQRAGILGVMSSYNDYDGVPISGSRLMLTDYLRKRFGFQGYVVSDSDAVKYLWSKHRIASDYTDACRIFLEAGGNVRTEFNPPKKFILPVRELVRSGRLSESVVNDRVRDVLRVKFQLGLFDHPYVENPAQANAIVHSPAHREVALRAARESIVLLKNSNQTLPLPKTIGSILVCGPNAENVDHSISRYGPVGGEVISVLNGIKAIVSPSTRVLYERGCEIVDDRWPLSEILPEPPSGSAAAMIAAAVEKARSVDAVIVALGDSAKTIGESHSRTSLDLPGYQNELVKALLATGKPVIAVLLTGIPATVNLLDAKAAAMVEAWFPGEFCGQAVAEVLFGDVNPGGKLPITFPKSIGQIEFNFPCKPASQEGMGRRDDPNGGGDTLVTGALYPFGYGLSYTRFEYQNIAIQPATIQPGESLTVSAQIKNCGDRAGDEVVQLYLRDIQSSVITYEKQLRGFERVHLQPGETKTVTFPLQKRDMELINAEFHRVVEPGVFEVEIAASSTDVRLQGKFEVTPP